MSEGLENVVTGVGSRQSINILGWSDLALIKEQILLLAQPLKMLNKEIVFADFSIKRKIFRGLASQKYATLKGDSLKLGSYDNLEQLGKCPFFFFKNLSTLIYSPPVG